MELRERVLTGARYTTLTSILQYVFSFAISVAMARLLDPETFGLLAMATVFTSINNLLVDFGTRDAIIRHEKVDRSFLSSVFWFNTAIGVIVSSIMLLASQLIANFYGFPILRWIVCLTSVKIIFSAMGIVPRAILMRNMNFKATFFEKMIVIPVSGIIAIVLALQGFGVWSLVAQQVMTVIVGTVLVWVFAAWFPKPSADIDHIRQIFPFSSYLSVTKFSNYFTKQGDLFLIGKFLGAVPLGIYSKGYGILRKPLKLVNGSILPVLFSAISKIQQDPPKLRSVYLQASKSMALIYFPIWVGGVLLAEPFVISLLGERWEPVVPLFPIFLTNLLFVAQASIGSHYLKALGEAQKLFVAILVSSVVIVSSFVIGLRWGTKGVAMGYCLATVFEYILLTTLVCRLINLSMMKILLNLKTVFFNALVMALGIHIALSLMSYVKIDSHLFSLAMGGTVGLLLYSMASWFTLPDARFFLREFLVRSKTKVSIS